MVYANSETKIFFDFLPRRDFLNTGDYTLSQKTYLECQTLLHKVELGAVLAFHFLPAADILDEDFRKDFSTPSPFPPSALPFFPLYF